MYVHKLHHHSSELIHQNIETLKVLEKSKKLILPSIGPAEDWIAPMREITIHYT